jgi:probable phosphoglycerate mutase
MTTFFLIRHAAHDLVGKALAGRQPGVFLNSAGLREAARIVEHLADARIDAIYASPRERAHETATPLAEARGLPVRVSAELDDIDFGQWTGRTFKELEADARWPIWCNRRTGAQPPGGETIAQVQQRTVAELARLAALHADQSVALFTHCDVIKCALAYYLAIRLDDLERFEIAPASVSVVLVGAGWSKVWRVNDTGEWPGGR